MDGSGQRRFVHLVVDLAGAWRCKWRDGVSVSLSGLQALLAMHLLFHRPPSTAPGTVPARPQVPQPA
jgi:hypothetical protein